MYEGMQGPAPPEVLMERDRVSVKFGETELIQTADSLIFRIGARTVRIQKGRHQ